MTAFRIVLLAGLVTGLLSCNAGPSAAPTIKSNGSPTAPTDEAGGVLEWAEAPHLGDVTVEPNRDSAVLVLPAFSGAKDYRAFRVPKGVVVDVDAQGRERIDNTVLFCAGERQRNAKATTPEVMTRLEVADVTETTTFVVEALDTLCPFPGVRGKTHQDITVDNTELPPEERVDFSLYTEAEIRSKYGSLIVNGHGKGPKLGNPGEAISPKVLARTTVQVTPRRGLLPPVATFFDDFNLPDPPVLVGAVSDGGRAQAPKRFENSKWSFYSYGAIATQTFIDRGQLHTVLADWAQDIFSTNVAYPKKVVKLSDTTYTHITFEVASNATQRRYWWLVLCGAASAGGTLDATGALKGSIIQTPFFMQDDGLNPSVEGWNCLQIFPRDGWPFGLEPSGQRPESDLGIRVNVAGGGANNRTSVRDVTPDQYQSSGLPRGWYRTRSSSGALTGPILDDQMLIAPRTHYDIYVKRDRVIIYVNGQQKVCNIFPNAKLTMAEGALGFGQVLYHTSYERREFLYDYNDRSGQTYYLNNTPFVDARSWDNLGFGEGASLPSGFDAGPCYTAP
jgi:hypothetical protein